MMMTLKKGYEETFALTDEYTQTAVNASKEFVQVIWHLVSRIYNYILLAMSALGFIAMVDITCMLY